jgi:hypothetical protein
MKKTVLFAVMAVLALTGCDNREQKKLNRQYISTAKSNAVKYIEDKYGFTPEVISAEQERKYGWINSTPLTTVYVRMNHGDRNFGVYIDGASENTDGSDNYQSRDIADCFCSAISEITGKPVQLTLKGGMVQTSFDPIENECINMYSESFDPSAPGEFFSRSQCSVLAEYVNTDISSISGRDLPLYIFKNNNKNEITLVSYRDKDYVGLYDQSSMLPFYAESRTIINRIETVHEDFSLGQVGDMSYYIKDEDGSNVTVREVVPDNGSEWDNEFFTAETASKAYSFRCDHDCEVNIFFPKSAIEPLDPKSHKTHRELGICRGTGSSRFFDTYNLMHLNDDYEICSFNLNADQEAYVVFLRLTNVKK